jgi:hypothetical protein
VERCRSPAIRHATNIADNYATHKHSKVCEWLMRHPRWSKCPEEIIPAVKRGTKCWILSNSVHIRIMQHHPVAIQAAAEKLVCRPPQMAKAPIVEFTKALNNECTVGIEVARPLLEGEEIL